MARERQRTTAERGNAERREPQPDVKMTASRWISEQPLTALAIVAAVGFLVGRLAKAMVQR